MKPVSRLPIFFVLLFGFVAIAAVTQYQATTATLAAQQPSVTSTFVPIAVTLTAIPSDSPVEKLVVTKLEDTDDGHCDPDDCSLRESIAEVKNEGEISFLSNLTGTIYLSSIMTIDKKITIIGNGSTSKNIILKAMTGRYAILVHSGAHLSLKRLTISGNEALSSSGGILNSSANLELSEVTFRGNRGYSALGNNGGHVIVNRSTFNDNQATSGGAINNDSGSIIITNCTFQGNRATGGGAIENVNGTILIEFSTFYDNEAVLGDTFLNSGELTLSNSIIFKSYTSAGYHIACRGSIIDGGNNIQYPSRDCSESIQVADPMLEVLSDNGGATQTIALKLGSPALDKGSSDVCLHGIQLIDQRGLPRDRNSCDIGAFELQS